MVLEGHWTLNDCALADIAATETNTTRNKGVAAFLFAMRFLLLNRRGRRLFQNK
jgi:hypothetical protein